MNIPFEKPFFNSFLVKKEDGNLIFHDFGGFETRNESHINIIRLSDDRFNFKDFDWVLINTDDRDHCIEYQGVKVLSVSSSSNNYNHVCPDFLFDKWPEVAINDYEEVCNQISSYGDNEPETNSLGWRGAPNPVRSLLVSQSDGVDIDAQWIQWIKKETLTNQQDNYLTINSPTNVVSNTYISIPEHSKKWRYLIDVEGAGHSGRINFFMFSKRVVFVVDRPWKQWFFEYMIPWEHYVPVNRDMSNLRENLNLIKNNSKLEQKIIQKGYEFAKKHLTRDSALSRWNQLLNLQGRKK